VTGGAVRNAYIETLNQNVVVICAVRVIFHRFKTCKFDFRVMYYLTAERLIIYCTPAEM